MMIETINIMQNIITVIIFFVVIMFVTIFICSIIITKKFYDYRKQELKLGFPGAKEQFEANKYDECSYAGLNKN